MAPAPVQRAIVIFPACADAELARVERVRAAYDPLAAQIPAHLTLVFPFASTLSTEALAAHVRAASAGVAPFAVELREVTGHMGEYLFLNVKRGNDPLIALHDRLYTGPLAPRLQPEYTYTPHLTLGRLVSDAAVFRAALADARSQLPGTLAAEVRELSVYRLDGADAWASECRVPLG